MVVADASALVEYLCRTRQAARIGKVVNAPNVHLHVPALCDIELAAALRRGLLSRRLSKERAGEVLEDYGDLPLTRHGHRTLLPHVLTLRHNFSAYDATYVALAQVLDAALLTADAGLARAARQHVVIAE